MQREHSSSVEVGLKLPSRRRKKEVLCLLGQCWVVISFAVSLELKFPIYRENCRTVNVVGNG